MLTFSDVTEGLGALGSAAQVRPEITITPWTTEAGGDERNGAVRIGEAPAVAVPGRLLSLRGQEGNGFELSVPRWDDGSVGPRPHPN
jgi:hypothetical protein